MTKTEFIKLVAHDADLTNRDATAAVNAVFDNLKKALINDETLSIQKFCTFSTRIRPGRNGHSPITGEKIWIEPKKTVKMTLSAGFKAQLNHQANEV